MATSKAFKQLPGPVLKRLCSLLAFEDILRCRLVCNAFFQATSDRFDQACAQYTFALDSDWLFEDLDFTDSRLASVTLAPDGKDETADWFDMHEATKANHDKFATSKRCLRNGVTVFRSASVFIRLRALRKVAINLRNTNDIDVPRWMNLAGGDVDRPPEFWPEDVTVQWLALTLRAPNMSDTELDLLEVGRGNEGDEIPLPLSAFQWRFEIRRFHAITPVTIHKLSLHINCDVHEEYPRRTDGQDQVQQSIEDFFRRSFNFKELLLTIADTYNKEEQSARWRLTSTLFSTSNFQSLEIDSRVIHVLPEEILAFCGSEKETLEKLSLRWLVLHPRDMEGMVKLLRAMRFRVPLLTSVALNVAWRREDGTEDSEQEFVAIMKEGWDGLEVMDNEIAALEEYLECLES